MLLVLIIIAAFATPSLAYNNTVLPQDPNTTLHQQFATVINPVCNFITSCPRKLRQKHYYYATNDSTTVYMYSPLDLMVVCFICGKHPMCLILVRQVCLNGHV